MADSIQLTDLDVIAKYSIAVRSATADRDELIAALRADLSWLEHGRSRTSTAFRAPAAAAADEYDDEDARDQADEPRPVRKTTARKTAARRTPR